MVSDPAFDVVFSEARSRRAFTLGARLMAEIGEEADMGVLFVALAGVVSQLAGMDDDPEGWCLKLGAEAVRIHRYNMEVRADAAHV